MKLSEFGQRYVNNSTCSSSVLLEKGGTQYIAYWNGLTNFAIVEDGRGNEVERLSTEIEYDDKVGNYLPNFIYADFMENGYRQVEVE